MSRTKRMSSSEAEAEMGGLTFPSLRRRIARAVDRDDAAEAGRLADLLRLTGRDYLTILGVFQRACPGLSRADFDYMMVEAEKREGWQR